MDDCYMANYIIGTISNDYKTQIEKENVDVIQLISICKLSTKSASTLKNIKLSDIQFSSPDFTRTSKDSSLTNISSPDFKKKHSFIIRVIYSCLKIGVEIFDIINNACIFKNIYWLIKSLEKTKRSIISDQIDFLNDHRKNPKSDFLTKYQKEVNDLITKIKLLDRIVLLLNEIVTLGILDSKDSLISMILPFFYSKYIEEYN